MSYRFLPWVRQGLAAEISTVDDLSATLPDRGRFPVRVVLSTGQSATRDVTLNGPGDVTGLDPRSIVRLEPPRSSTKADPDSFAAIEFDTPDLPWLFSPLAADAQDRLRPWLVLVVVAEQDGVSLEVGRGQLLPSLTIQAPAVPAAELPDLAESWAWAHAQVTGLVATESLPEHLTARPDQNVSRILCPRRLEPDRRYLACLVPAFEAGRQSGLGETVSTAGTTAPAWAAPDELGSSLRLPVYHHWSFATGPSGDFESLARRLTPRAARGAIGERSMFVGAAHPGLPLVAAQDGGTVTIESALRAPDGAEHLPALPEGLDGYLSDLVTLVNAPADHVLHGAAPGADALSPPLYGGPNLQVERLDGTEPTWLGELNRDPRHRAAAGLGAEVVRQNQEVYMNAAWAQVGEVVAANQRWEQARFLGAVADRTRSRHVAPLSREALLGISGPVHRRIGEGAQTVHATIEQSFLPAAVTSAGYRRMTSPRSPYVRRARRELTARAATPTARSSSESVLQRLASGQLRLQHHPTLGTENNPKPRPESFAPVKFSPRPLDLEAVRITTLTAIDPFLVAATRAASTIRIADRSLGDLLAELFADLLEQLGEVFEKLLRRLLEALADLVQLYLNSVMGGPDLSIPLFRDLAAYAPERFLAGTGGSVPDDSVSLLQPNPRFIEAFLIGANHEMNRELLWRGFPTYRRGTPFRRFWDRTDDTLDLPALYLSPPEAHLGELSDPSASGALTLLVRGQLLRRFPDTVIYAAPANADGTVSADPGAAINPLFWGRLGDDLVYVGFDLTRQQAEAGHGWCFVLAEQPAASKFGLDTPARGKNPMTTWSDLNWDQVAVAPGGHLNLAASGLSGQTRALAPGAPPATFARNSAHLAAITMQRPFRAVLHSRDLLAGVDRPAEAEIAPVLTHARLLRPINQGPQ